MIESCIERLKQDLCGGCDRRHACNFHWSPREGRRPNESGRNPFLSFLDQVAKAIEHRSRPKQLFRKRVERQLEPLLATGTVSVGQLACELGCSRQTLYRRLKAEGITFVEVLDQLRRRLALRLVRDEGLSVKETAYRLGFSDSAAFSRAFKRWTGTSPGAMRRGVQ
jgi:AraC-like DNA-binding protein